MSSSAQFDVYTGETMDREESSYPYLEIRGVRVPHGNDWYCGISAVRTEKFGLDHLESIYVNLPTIPDPERLVEAFYLDTEFYSDEESDDYDWGTFEDGNFIEFGKGYAYVFIIPRFFSEEEHSKFLGKAMDFMKTRITAQ